MKYNNYKNQQSLKQLAIEQLRNVLLQYGKTIDFTETSETLDIPIVIANLKHGWVGNVTINSVGIDSNGVIELDAEDTEYGDAMKVDINEITGGHIGYITEDVMAVAELEGRKLSPFTCPSKEELSECMKLAEYVKDSVLDYLSRHDDDGDLSFNDDELVLYLGGMAVDVESAYVEDNKRVALSVSCYEFGGSLYLDSLNTANLRIIEEYFDNH